MLPLQDEPLAGLAPALITVAGFSPLARPRRELHGGAAGCRDCGGRVPSVRGRTASPIRFLFGGCPAATSVLISALCVHLNRV
ncbi:hypothetical protein [Mycobacterium lepromatosis]|uniref:hypothetical protein n=1 Tax=Mycobacterium lepromatosis TaxID=480418 RepID=UPI000A90405A|nr:hypothetical protein [Mycobacterium lepromatosis]